MNTQRADARRNYARLLSVAEEAIAVHGADASLEQIARTAGVGSATARRHFPTRRALLEAVFRDRVDTLCASARSLTEALDTQAAPDARAALVAWLEEVTASAAGIRGLAMALIRDNPPAPGEPSEHCATDQLTEAGAPLVLRAAGALTPGVTVHDVLTLVTGIALAAEHHPDPAGEAGRLLALAVSGIAPR